MYAQRIISLLAEHDSLLGIEIAKHLGCLPGNCAPALRSLVSSGVLIATRDGRSFRYSLANSEPGVFCCALFSDGDLQLINAGADGDVSLLLTKEQTVELVRYLHLFDHSDLKAAQPNEQAPS